MQYKATSPEDYILQVPKERQNTLKRLRKTIVDNIPKGFEEGIQYGMIGYYVLIRFIQMDTIVIQKHHYHL